MTTLHISWPIHHDDGHFPTIRLRQSTHLTKCPAHSHINFCSDKSTQIQRYKHAIIVMDRLLLRCFSKLSLHFCTPDLSASLKVNMQQTQYLNILDSFQILDQFPIPCQIYRKEQLLKTKVLKSVDACNRKLVTQGERES